MLCLSRKKGESIVINNEIVITILEIRGDKIRLGIAANRQTPVHRSEVWEQVHKKTIDDLLQEIGSNG